MGKREDGITRARHVDTQGHMRYGKTENIDLVFLLFRQFGEHEVTGREWIITYVPMLIPVYRQDSLPLRPSNSVTSYSAWVLH